MADEKRRKRQPCSLSAQLSKITGHLRVQMGNVAVLTPPSSHPISICLRLYAANLPAAGHQVQAGKAAVRVSVKF